MTTAALEGIVVINKPEGWTSHDVVGKLRGILGTRRVGHLGTLDPIATGVLPVMVGQATRLAQFWNKADKGYEAVIRFGFATSTYDRQGDPLGPDLKPNVTAEQIEACIAPMRGQIDQIPPPVSAKKVNGVPAYKLARKNIEVELAPVRVSLYELSVLSAEGSFARLKIHCSAGTYVRAIAHELGLLLGCGAHVHELTRTRSGPFLLGDAITIETLQSRKDEGALETALLPATDLLPHFPSVFVDDVTVTHIRQGRDFQVSAFRANPGSPHVKAIGPDGRLIAIGEIALPHVYHPVVVLN